MSDRKRTLWAGLCLAAVISVAIALPVEPDQYRLLSISKSAKMILISQLPSKTKYLLDATTAKITVDGKPAEFQSLQAYTIVRVKFESRKASKDGIDIDGVATEIQVTTPENRK
jgi:hypothetical protein